MESGTITPRTRRVAWVLIGVGACIRIFSFFSLANVELDPDAGNYLNLARAFSWSAPLAGSYGEPLWIALVKAVTAPFDYAVLPYRIGTTVVSIAALALSWPLYNRLLRPTAALIALAFISLNGLLTFIAPRGLREDLVMLLLVAATLATVRLARGESRGFGAAAAVFGLCLVRLELGMFALLAMIVVAVLWKPFRAVAAAGLIISVAVTVPWLIATESRFGDPMYHSNYSATYFTYEELDDRGVDHPPLSEAETTWGEYYLELLGPAETAERFAIGLPSLIGGLFYNSVFPIRPVRLTELAPSLGSLVPILRIVATAFAALATLVLLASLRVWRQRIVWMGWTFFLGGLAAYAPLSRHLVVSYRLVAFTLIPLALLFGVGAVQTVDLMKRRDGSTNDH